MPLNANLRAQRVDDRRYRALILSFLLVLVASLFFAAKASAQNQGMSAGQALMVDHLTTKISAIEWLAPLAPVALSPFFGIALLSGLACFGPDWLPDNAMFGEHSPLANAAIFWIFLALTVATSLPRLSKVSKPVAQFADFLETYSAIVILIGLKIINGMEPANAESAMIIKAGVLEFGADTFLAIAMAINIIVINAVKFFFEFLVWVTPVPMLDAAFESANKAICALLMGIYAYSPVLALVLNLLLFAICLYIFSWAKRREVYFRTAVTDYVLGWFIKGRGATPPDQLTVFPAYDVTPIKRRSKCSLAKTKNGFRLTQRRWLRSPLEVHFQGEPVIERDWWTNSVNFPDGIKLTFTSRYNACLEELAEQLGGYVHKAASQTSDQKHARQIEFG